MLSKVITTIIKGSLLIGQRLRKERYMNVSRRCVRSIHRGAQKPSAYQVIGFHWHVNVTIEITFH